MKIGDTPTIVWIWRENMRRHSLFREAISVRLSSYQDAYGFSKSRNIHKTKPKDVYKYLTEALPITWRVDTDQVHAEMFWIEHKSG